MQPGTDKLLRKAEGAARTAASALEAGVPAAAAARAFYAMLYAAKALLNERGVRLREHARIAAALGRIPDTGQPRLHAWLLEALARRGEGDRRELTYDEVAQLVERAHEAVVTTRSHVGSS